MKGSPCAWAVKMDVWCGGYYFGWSKNYPKGYAAPLRAKKSPPLLFATETEAEIALDAYLGMVAAPYPVAVMQVKAKPTHRLTNEGFAPRPIEEEFPLFRQS